MAQLSVLFPYLNKISLEDVLSHDWKWHFEWELFHFEHMEWNRSGRIQPWFHHICKIVAVRFLECSQSVLCHFTEKEIETFNCLFLLSLCFFSGTSELSICYTQYLLWISVVWSSTILAQ